MGTLASRLDAEVEPDPLALSEREAARDRLQERRDFGGHVVVYFVVNAFLVGVWMVTGAGYFWPVWILACWGIGLVLHGWNVFFRHPITEAEIDAEIQRQHRR
jgi:hypothetical protein